MRRRRSFFQTVVHSRWPWFCLIFLVPGLILLGVSALMFRVEWQYHTSAEQTTGIVLGKWSTFEIGSRAIGTGSSVSYHIRYEFRPAFGGPREDSDTVSQRYWDTLKRGNSLRVFYLPSHPNHSRLSRGMRVGFPLILLVVGGMFTLMGGLAEVGIVTDLWRTYLKKHPRSLHEGQPG